MPWAMMVDSSATTGRPASSARRTSSVKESAIATENSSDDPGKAMKQTITAEAGRHRLRGGKLDRRRTLPEPRRLGEAHVRRASPQTSPATAASPAPVTSAMAATGTGSTCTTLRAVRGKRTRRRRDAARHWQSPEHAASRCRHRPSPPVRAASCCALGVMAKTGAPRSKARSFCALGTETGSISSRTLALRREAAEPGEAIRPRGCSPPPACRPAPSRSATASRCAGVQRIHRAHVVDGADQFARLVEHGEIGAGRCRPR